MVHLVADQSDAVGVAPPGDGGQFRRRDDGAGRVGGAGDDHPLHRRVEFGEHPDRGLEPGLFVALDLDDLTAQRREDVAVTRVAGAGDGHPVAGVEAGQEGEQETTGGPGGEHDVVDGDLEAELIAVGVRDSPAKFRNTKGHRVSQRPRPQCTLGRGEHRCGCTHTRLARRQVHQVAVGPLAFSGR